MNLPYRSSETPCQRQPESSSTPSTPAEAVIVTLLLAFLPYLLLRGLVARVARRWVGPATAKGAR